MVEQNDIIHYVDRSHKVVYAKQNGGKYTFLIDGGNSIPNDQVRQGIYTYTEQVSMFVCHCEVYAMEYHSEVFVCYSNVFVCCSKVFVCCSKVFVLR